jgi:antitoxin HicB
MTEDHRSSIVIAWSDADGVYVVSLPEWGDLVHTHGATQEEALQRGKELLDGLLSARLQRGEQLPPPRVFPGA